MTADLNNRASVYFPYPVAGEGAMRTMTDEGVIVRNRRY